MSAMVFLSPVFGVLCSVAVRKVALNYLLEFIVKTFEYTFRTSLSEWTVLTQLF